MEWISATSGADHVRRDENYYGSLISIGGKQYEKGVWTHSFNSGAPADVVVDVKGKDYARFAAEVGLDDASGGGSVQFQVLADEVIVAESPILYPRQVHSFNVSIDGAKQVRLRLLNGGDGWTCDHSAWGYARFVLTGADDPLAR
jgi:hypothetical protein